MRKHKIEQGDYFISDDLIRNLREIQIQSLKEKNEYESKVALSSQEIAQRWADAVLSTISDPLIMEYQEIYGKLTGLDRIAILNAHGSVFNKRDWVYTDGKKERYVQNWINKRDGKYNSLILFSCYHQHELNLGSRKSLLLIPDRKIRVDGDISIVYPISWTLFDPRLGEVSPYAYEYEINQMKKQLGEN